NQVAFRVPVHVLEQVLGIIRALGAGLRPAWHKGARRNGRLSGQHGGGEYGQSQALDESQHNSVDYSSQPSAVKPQSEPRRGALWAGERMPAAESANAPFRSRLCLAVWCTPGFLR